MSNSDTSGFAKFVPGFDFLQNLAKGASANVPQMPSMGNWVAPTLNVEELDKRIGELKNVQFWLEQNSRALSATIQALEVQRMTLATLKGMNFNLGDIAAAFKPKTTEPAASSVQKAAEKPTEKAPETVEPEVDTPRPAAKTASKAEEKATGGLVDPLQLWGSLTQQFQNIAASALKEVASKTAVDLSKTMAAGVVKGAAKATAGAAKKTAAKKSPARKSAARKAAGR
jgi:hypothetical protein